MLKQLKMCRFHQRFFHNDGLKMKLFFFPKILSRRLGLWHFTGYMVCANLMNNQNTNVCKIFSQNFVADDGGLDNNEGSQKSNI